MEKMTTAQKTFYTNSYDHLVRSLIAARTKRGWTQRQLAAAAGRDQCFIGRTETGKRRLDAIEAIDLFRTMGMSRGEILKIMNGLI